MNATTALPRHGIQAPRITLHLMHVTVTFVIVVALLGAGLGARALLGSRPGVNALMLRDIAGHELVTASSGPAGQDGRDLAIRGDVAARLDAHVRWWRAESSLVVEVLYLAPDDETTEQATRLMQASFVDGSETYFDVPAVPGAVGTRRVQGETTLDAVVFSEGPYAATIGVITDEAGGPSATELAVTQAELIP